MLGQQYLISLLWCESVVCGPWIDRLLQSGLISYSRGMSGHVLVICLTWHNRGTKNGGTFVRDNYSL